MYAISNISTFYCPKANEYRAAESLWMALEYRNN